MSGPKTVARLREMMEGAHDDVRAESTVLWAADRIEELEAENARLVAQLEAVRSAGNQLAEALEALDRGLFVPLTHENARKALAAWAALNVSDGNLGEPT